jgi:hypothetical protein
MRATFLILLCLVLQSCGISLLRNKDSYRNPPPTVEVIKFDNVDSNNDGKITEQEVESYNSSKTARESRPNIKFPLYFLGIIGGLIILICAGPKILKFILGLFKNK